MAKKNDDLDICDWCNGSGEGVADTVCYQCKGTGGVPLQKGANTSFTRGPWSYIPWQVNEGENEVRAPDDRTICTTSRAELIQAGRAALLKARGF